MRVRKGGWYRIMVPTTAAARILTHLEGGGVGVENIIPEN